MKVVRHIFLVLLSLLVMLVPASSKRDPLLQNSNRSPAFTSETLGSSLLPANPPQQPEVLSPYSIKEFILQDRNDGDKFFVDLTPVWQALQIDSGEFETFKGFTSGYDTWLATILRFFIPATQTRLAILKIATDWDDDRRYLVFKELRADESNGQQWAFLGNVDFIFNRHLDSVNASYNRIVTDGENIWLLLRYQSNGGTGGFSVSESWYRIGEKVTKVLDYPTKGYYANDYLCNRAYSTRIIRQGQSGGIYTVEILYSVEYTGEGIEITKKQTGTYSWDTGAGRFVLDPRKSELSEEEIDNVYGGAFIEYERLLEYNFQDLKRIAEHANAKQREWLLEALSRMPDFAKKQDLERILRAGR